jgi:hypothetical protein
MRRKSSTTAQGIKRQQLADPHAGTPHSERLKQAGAIDLRHNKLIEHHGGGYVTVRPIDPSKRFKKK